MKNTQNIPKSEFKEEEWTEPEKGTQWPKQIRREYLKKLAVDMGLYNVNKTELAQKMGISRKQLYNDIKAIVKGGLDRDELQHSTLKLRNAMEKVLKEMHQILITGKAREKTRAAEVMLKASEAYTDFLEKFGIKEIQTPITESNITIQWGKDPKKKVKK